MRQREREQGSRGEKVPPSLSAHHKGLLRQILTCDILAAWSKVCEGRHSCSKGTTSLRLSWLLLLLLCCCNWSCMLACRLRGSGDSSSSYNTQKVGFFFWSLGVNLSLEGTLHPPQGFTVFFLVQHCKSSPWTVTNPSANRSTSWLTVATAARQFLWCLYSSHWNIQPMNF